MKITYDTLPTRYEEIKKHLTQSTIDAVDATLPIWDMYGDADFRQSIDDVIELVNNEIASVDNEPKPAPAPKPEPKAEPKPAEKPKTAKKSEEKPAKAGEQPKQPKAKYKVGDWVWAKVNDAEQGKGKMRALINDVKIEDGKVLYNLNILPDDYIPQSEIISKAAAPKAPKAPKQPEGEPVAKVSPEVAIIKRFVNCCKGKNAGNEKGRESARKILAALQNHIVNKEIRKTSKYAKEIIDIQKALLTIVYEKKKAEFDKAEFERLENIAHSEYQETIAKLSRSFIRLIGKDGVKDKAKNLLQKFEDCDESDSLIDEMKKALKAYIEGKAATIETGARSLQGIFGLAGI